MVVRVDGRRQPIVGAEIAPSSAEVPGSGERGVPHVLRIDSPIAVTVRSIVSPGGGQELHRPDRPVPAAAAVEGTAVAVPNGSETGGTVQPRSEDGRSGGTVPAGSAGAAAGRVV